MCQLCRTRANILSCIDRVSEQLALVSVSRGNTKAGRLECANLRRSLDSLAKVFSNIADATVVPELANVVQGSDTLDGPDCDTVVSERHGLDETHEHGDPGAPAECKATQVKRRRIGF